MVTLQETVLNNVGWAAALAIVATLVGRIVRQRPALSHALWLLVLLKLVTPSMVNVAPGWIAERTMPPPIEISHRSESLKPSPISTPSPLVSIETPKASAVSTKPSASPRNEPKVAARVPWPWRSIVLAVWMLGAMAWWAKVVAQTVRFQRLFRGATKAPDELLERVDRLARQVGLGRGPAVWLVAAKVPPMLWALVGRPRLLLPEELWKGLDEAQQETILVHELAHLKRRDHWVRRLELVVLGLYWWNPIAWWARKQVEKAEEECCDAWVVWALPEAVEAYAEALVATAVFLSSPRSFRPFGASGAGRVLPLRERLNMILCEPAKGLMRRPASRAVLILGASGLLLLPACGWRQPVVASQQRKEATETTKVVQPLVADVSDYEDFQGHVESGQTIELRSQVGGTLVKVHVQSGQTVERGTLLFDIDPRPYGIELQKAEAEVARAEAQLKRRKTELANTNKLFNDKVISQHEVDLISSDVAGAEAALESAKATATLAKLMLDETKIKAPIQGKVSLPRLAAGSLVTADSTVLATIDSLNSLHVGFDVDQTTVVRLGRERREGKIKLDLAPGVRVFVGLNGEGLTLKGTIDSVDPRFDSETNTLHCRAEVSKSDELLMPGLSVRVRLFKSAPTKSLLIPESAVSDSNDGWGAVRIVSAEGVVTTRFIKLGSLQDELRRIDEGLEESDLVAVGVLNDTGRLIVNGQSEKVVKPERMAITFTSPHNAPVD